MVDLAMAGKRQDKALAVLRRVLSDPELEDVGQMDIPSLESIADLSSEVVEDAVLPFFMKSPNPPARSPLGQTLRAWGGYWVLCLDKGKAVSEENLYFVLSWAFEYGRCSVPDFTEVIGPKGGLILYREASGRMYVAVQARCLKGTFDNEP